MMKTMKCNQLSRACDREFQVDHFEEISEMIINHVMEMYQIADIEYLKVTCPQKMIQFVYQDQKEKNMGKIKFTKKPVIKNVWQLNH